METEELKKIAVETAALIDLVEELETRTRTLDEDNIVETCKLLQKRYGSIEGALAALRNGEAKVISNMFGLAK